MVVSEVVLDREGTLDAAARLGCPVALKAVSGVLVHKSEAGAVALGTAGPAALIEAYRKEHLGELPLRFSSSPWSHPGSRSSSA